jgi:hypothetical protein
MAALSCVALRSTEHIFVIFKLRFSKTAIMSVLKTDISVQPDLDKEAPDGLLSKKTNHLASLARARPKNMVSIFER